MAVWNTLRRERIARERLHNADVIQVDFLGRNVASLDSLGEIHLSEIDEPNGELEKRNENELAGLIRKDPDYPAVLLCSDPEKNRLVVLYRHQTEANYFLQISAGGSKPEVEIEQIGVESEIQSIAFVKERICFKTEDGKIEFLFPTLYRKKYSLSRFSSPVYSVAFSPSARCAKRWPAGRMILASACGM